MIRHFRRLTLQILIGLNIGWLASSCHDNDQSKIRSVEGTLDPKPLDSDDIESQLKRYAGQTEFLNVSSSAFLPVLEAASDQNDFGGQADGPREIQEADLFKVGKEGSKLLYVLNPYRGLQVIDFSDGSDQPKRLGRTDATGNEVIEMIFDETNMHIVVLERNWMAQGGVQAYLQVYSVKDPTRPSHVQTHELRGDVADSRQVGSIFYVATSRWNNYQSIGGEGYVTSYSLEADGLREVNSYTLALPVSSLGNMNIVETEEKGRYSYHLISVLSENHWGWWDRQSTVEVVDISNPKGLIKPVIMVSTKGQLRERSSTHIKDGTLIAVSNSWSQGENPVRRVTVESFVLPKEGEKAVDQLEADFRRLWFEKKMKEKPAQANSDDYAAQLSADPEYGLKGLFVRQNDGRLTKVVADNSVTVGDTTGLHADLQDVRFVNNRLYVFWVPANQIDPLDVFDITAPQTEVKYLGRTLFDGWMERAIPFTYQGQDFVLGLGWVVPAVGENPTRKPQVMIFRLPEGQTLAPKAEIIAQLTLTSPDLWASFNEADKSITVRTTGDGQGLVIFPAFSWGEKAKSGGKIVAFDMSSKGALLKEGGFLQADAAWLRRVFSNPEIDKMHTLSDRALGTFNLNSENYGAADQVFDAISILEMARDIRGYGQIAAGQDVYGLQFVDISGASFEDTSSELRVINARRADSETTLRRVSLPGRYENHLVSREGDIYALTRQNKIDMENGVEVWSQKLVLNRIRIRDDKGLLVTPQIARIEWTPGSTSYGHWGLYAPVRPLFLERGDTIVISEGDKLSAVRKGQTLQLTEANASCLPEGRLNTEYRLLDSRLFVGYETEVTINAEGYESVRLSRSYMAPLNDSYTVECALAVNIPGKAIRLEGDRLVTDDQRFLGFNVESPIVYPVDNLSVDSNKPMGIGFVPHRWPNTARVLDGLKLQGTRAELKDIYALGTAQGEVLVEDQLYTFEQAQQWAPRFLSRIGFNGERFDRSAFLYNVPQNEYSWPLVAAVIQSEQGPLFLIQEGTKAKLYETTGDQLKAIEVQIVHQNEILKASESFLLPEWLDPISAAHRTVYDAGRDRLAIAQGLYGVVELQLKQK